MTLRVAHWQTGTPAAPARGAQVRPLADAHARGLVHGDPRSLTLLSWSLVHGLSSLILDGQARVSGEQPAVEAVAERLGSLLLDGMRSRP